MAVTRREFMERTLGAAALTGVAPCRVAGPNEPFILLIGGLCFHDSDDSRDYRIWMPKYDPKEPHQAVLIKRKADSDKTGDHPTTAISPELESVPLDGCEVTITVPGPPKLTPDKAELKFSYELPYPANRGLMTSWSSLDWFFPCRKFLNNKLAAMEQRRRNSNALVHVASAKIGAIWPVGEKKLGTDKQDVTSWEISVGSDRKAVRAIPNWALAELPAAACLLTLTDLYSGKDLGTIALTEHAAIAFLPVKTGTHANGGDPSKHFKLFDPILKPHDEVKIYPGGTFELEREFQAGSLDERVSHFLDKVEDLVAFRVINRSTRQIFEAKTAGSTACPPSHDP